jgi:hypothetical protein
MSSIASSSASNATNDECSICLSALTTGSPLLTLSCGHKFHLQCLSLNIKAKNKECPLCRSPLETSLSQLLSGVNNIVQQRPQPPQPQGPQQQQQQQQRLSRNSRRLPESVNFSVNSPTEAAIIVSNWIHSSSRIYFIENQIELQFSIIKILEILRKEIAILQLSF